MLDLNIIKSNSENQGKAELSSLSPSLFLITLVLGFILFGLTMLYSTSSGIGAGPNFFIKQSRWAFIGCIGAGIIYFIGLKTLSKYSMIILVIVLFALIATLFFPPIKGARRWIRLPFMSIQPSEFAKIAIILYLAQFLAKKQRFIDSISSVFPALCWVVATLFLILLGEDLGTTLLIFATVWLMLFVAGMKLRWLFLVPAIFVPIGAIYITFFDQERLSRLSTYLTPEVYRDDASLQLWNSLLALGSGGWTGLGFTKSRIKAMYLPEAHNDFILAIVGEELGFLCMFFIVSGYAIIMALGIWISMRAEDKSKMLLGMGATALITIQAIINLGVVSGALPTKGMPAPFISYGGSNMVMSLCCIGLLLCIEKERKPKVDNV